jgi:hypothetical protein
MGFLDPGTRRQGNPIVAHFGERVAVIAESGPRLSPSCSTMRSPTGE